MVNKQKLYGSQIQQFKNIFGWVLPTQQASLKKSGKMWRYSIQEYNYNSFIFIDVFIKGTEKELSEKARNLRKAAEIS